MLRKGIINIFYQDGRFAYIYGHNRFYLFHIS